MSNLQSPTLIVANQLKITEEQVNIVLKMLENGDTVPFISRYRKDATGGLSDEQIYQIEDLHKYQKELIKRKEAIIKTLEEKNLLTEELKNNLLQAQSKAEVEAIYQPYKEGKITKATEAISLGLEPLAKRILNNRSLNFSAYKEAKNYLSDKVPTPEKALELAGYIIAQIFSQDLELRKSFKEIIWDRGIIISTKNPKVEDENETFKNYYEYKNKIKYIKNHNVMAINRGVDLKVLKLSFEYNKDFLLKNILWKYDFRKINQDQLYWAAEDALKRLILPSLEREIFSDLFATAESNSIVLFSNLVEKILNGPAVSGHNIIAIDPAFANGCKLAALNENGEVLDEVVKVFPPFAAKFTSAKNVDNAEKITLNLIQKHNISIIVIGNGTASRETEKFISDLIAKYHLPIKYAIVSEVGASVYSASKSAREEFPNLDEQQRSAINIGRKYLDPLNELIKIDPKSLGVGQYQHDVNQKELQNYLDFKVQKVVSSIGVDLNAATKEILTYVPGLSTKHAQNIIEHKKEHGLFNNRNELKKVKGIGAKTFEQAVGFLRIFNSKEFLDKTFIHPESYQLTKGIISDYSLNPNEAGIDVSFLNADQLAKQYNSNIYDIELILNALSSPTKLIRNSKDGFILKDSIINDEDLQPQMQIQGTVSNVTDFGLFLYIGVKTSLFIHSSKLKLNKDQSPIDLYYPGMILNCVIENVDLKNKKISGALAG
ncbi:helix-hairpin-helix domain-containing protein [Mycoplasmopsis citelli]|uniref:helix-hairpin-helix domain-containing protein n=1 Tax=Mycoplasmopsis citelli TaxID=171281 RepID=UPI002114021D|nr:Tex-like N-terminal domain-containing protein [Mycoplasmopsis citelli]UUD35913.1 helix-hairpin-helix domain-containing protein [Mycoplasmopsis citelli]